MTISGVRAMTQVRIGSNLLNIGLENVVIRRTTFGRVMLLFWDFLLCTVVIVAATLIGKANQAFHWPTNIIGWLSLITIVSFPIYFISASVRTTLKGWKTYQLTKTYDDLLVNGKVFAPHVQTTLLLKRKIGWEGIGQSFEVQLIAKQKILAFSFGNNKQEAQQIAATIGEHFGLPAKLD